MSVRRLRPQMSHRMRRMKKTKHCPVCKTEKLLTEFHRDRGRGDGHASTCKPCKNKRDTKYTTIRKIRLRKRKDQWLTLIHANKMKCSVCGYSKCFEALDQHHNDPNEKDFEISRFMQKPFNKENQKTLLKELGKCICMCANCHREFHALQRKGGTKWT